MYYSVRDKVNQKYLRTISTSISIEFRFNAFICIALVKIHKNKTYPLILNLIITLRNQIVQKDTEKWTIT